jgi:hypothetical protein
MAKINSSEKLEGHMVRMPARIWRSLAECTPSRDWAGAVNLLPTIAEEFLESKKREAEKRRAESRNDSKQVISLGEDL